MRNTPIAGLLAALFAFAAPSAARAQLLYSVDWNSDELVSIDPESGQVRVVGPLGLDAYDTDLTALNGKLYAVDSHSWDRVDLLEIDSATGGARVLAQLSGAIGAIPHAEGLAAKGGLLYVGYGPWVGWPNAPILGVVGMNGVVADVFDFFPVVRDADLDGLAAGFDGTLLGTDNKVGTSVLLSRVTTANPTYTTSGAIYNGADACCGRGDDLDFVGLRLYVGNGATGTIARISPKNGAVLKTIQLSRAPAGGYSGLAVGPSNSCHPLALTAWRRACTDKDPWGENGKLEGYAESIREYDPFSSLAGGSDLCARLKSSGKDKCAQAESGLLALMLNIDSLRLARTCCATGTGPTVTETLAAIFALLGNPARTQQDCASAQLLADGINTGTALCP